MTFKQLLGLLMLIDAMCGIDFTDYMIEFTNATEILQLKKVPDCFDCTIISFMISFETQSIYIERSEHE